MDFTQLAQAYYQFGFMFLLFSIGIATIVAVLDSLPAKQLPKLAEQH
jgi:hypothetical protein